MKIVTKRMINRLPFEHTAISEWTEGTDLFKFITDLSDHKSIVFREDGTESWIDMRNVGRLRYQDLYKHFLSVAKEFEFRAGLENPNEFKAKFGENSIRDDRYFGRLAKYYIAWYLTTRDLLSDGTFFSYAHLLESLIHIDAAIILGASLYYRQSLQLIRTYLEELVIGLHLAFDNKSFSLWRDGKFRNPQLRGKRGLLNKMQEKQIISQNIADRISKMYDIFNSAIHGKEEEFVFAGMHKGTAIGKAFSIDRLHKWSQYVSEAIDVGIHVFRIIEAESHRIFDAHATSTCRLCHRNSMKEIRSTAIGSHSVVVRECIQCKYQSYDCTKQCNGDHSSQISFCSHEDGCKCLTRVWGGPPVFKRDSLSARWDA